MTMQVTEELIRQLPKADLHVHLDGSLRLTTLLELAEQQGVQLPADNPEDLAKQVMVQENCVSLEEYLRPFAITLSVMQTREALTRIAYELCEDSAAENVRYIEVRYSPILHTQRGLRLTEIQDAVLEGIRLAEKQFDISGGVIVCGIRTISPETSYLLAEHTVAYKNRGVVGFDLAGDEYMYPAKDHRDAFFLILRNNVNTTLHAGEAYGPESIHQAIHYCGAHRIGHGTRLKEDGDLLNYVNDHRIPLEICPSSNVQTGVVKSLDHHPLRFYYDYGLRVTVNTDNRLVSNTTLSRELFLAHKHLDFNFAEIKDLIVHSFKSTFQHYRDKVNLINRVLTELQNFPSNPTEAEHLQPYVRVSP